LLDREQHAFQIFQHLDRRNAQDANPLLRQPGLPTLIVLNALGSIMRRAIDFNGQPYGETKEVEDIRPDGVLAPKA
jgi:hypothetical protein